MRITVILASLLVANATLALGPTVDCRFAAFERGGDVALDEAVVFTTAPGAFVEGDFDPYEIRISSGATAFEISIRLDGKLISRLHFPLVQLADLPVGSSVFGISSSAHRVVDGLESIQYECIKTI